MSEVRCGTCRHFQRDDPVCVGCTDIGTPFYRKWEPVENTPAPQTVADLRRALELLAKVYDAMGAPRGPARIMADAALAAWNPDT